MLCYLRLVSFPRSGGGYGYNNGYNNGYSSCDSGYTQTVTYTQTEASTVTVTMTNVSDSWCMGNATRIDASLSGCRPSRPL